MTTYLVQSKTLSPEPDFDSLAESWRELAEDDDLHLPARPKDVGLDDLADDDAGEDGFSDLLTQWKAEEEELVNNERDSRGFHLCPPLSHSVTPPLPTLDPALEQHIATARAGLALPNNSKAQRALYSQLPPVRVWAVEGETPAGFDDRCLMFEASLIDYNRPDRWVTLHSTPLRDSLGNKSRDVISDLEAWGRIEVDYHYIVDSHARRYRLAPALAKAPKTRRLITSGAQLARYYRHLGEMHVRQLALLDDPVNLALYTSAATVRYDITRLPPDFADDVQTDNEREELSRQIARLTKGHEFPFLREDVSGRLYHQSTTTPKRLRPAAHVNGEPLRGLDVRASHWLSFVAEYEASNAPRAEDLKALRSIYRAQGWTAVGGKEARNSFLCGGERNTAHAWLKRNAPHALAWFLELKLRKGRGIYKLWVAGERRRARAIYLALISAGISTILDMHDGFEVLASDAERAFAIAQEVLAAETAGLGLLAYEDGKHETLVNNEGDSSGFHLCPPLSHMAIPTPAPLTKTQNINPPVTRYSLTAISEQQETAGKRSIKLSGYSDTQGIPSAYSIIGKAVEAGYEDREIRRAIDRASRLPIPRRKKALAASLGVRLQKKAS